MVVVCTNVGAEHDLAECVVGAYVGSCAHEPCEWSWPGCWGARAPQQTAYRPSYGPRELFPKIFFCDCRIEVLLPLHQLLCIQDIRVAPCDCSMCTSQPDARVVPPSAVLASVTSAWLVCMRRARRVACGLTCYARTAARACMCCATDTALRVLCIRDTCRMGTCVLATDRARCVLRIRNSCFACTCVLRDGRGTVCASHPEHVRSGR